MFEKTYKIKARDCSISRTNTFKFTSKTWLYTVPIVFQTFISELHLRSDRSD